MLTADFMIQMLIATNIVWFNEDSSNDSNFCWFNDWNVNGWFNDSNFNGYKYLCLSMLIKGCSIGLYSIIGKYLAVGKYFWFVW